MRIRHATIARARPASTRRRPALEGLEGRRLLSAAPGADQQPRVAAGPQAPAGSYIVVLDDDVADPAAEARAMVPSGVGEVGYVYQHALKGFSAHLPAQAAAALARNPRVKYVEPDGLAHTTAQVIPAGIRRIGADQGQLPEKIDGVDERVDVDVAILDSGIDDDHPDLNVVGGVGVVPKTGSPFNTQYTYNTSPSAYDDDNGHGTHVAGTVAALDNGLGVVGVAPGARLWAVKVLDSGGNAPWSRVIAGIDWVTARAGTIEVANMSLGGPYVRSVNDATQEMINAGVFVAVSAGNDARDAGGDSPASVADAFTVSAMVDTDGAPGGLGASTPYGPDDTLATFSNFGSVVDAAAPGVDVYSTYPGGGYATASGTSMASPHVAGAAARYIAANHAPTASAADVRAITAALLANGRPMAEWRPDARDTDSDPDPYHEPMLSIGQVAPAPARDIAITSVSASPGSVAPGETVTISVTVKNVGTAPVTDDFAVSLTESPGGTPFAAQVITEDLAAGASTVVSFTWNTATDTALGNHTLGASLNLSDEDPTNDAGSTVVTVATTSILFTDDFTDGLDPRWLTTAGAGGTWSHAYEPDGNGIYQQTDTTYNHEKKAMVSGTETATWIKARARADKWVNGGLARLGVGLGNDPSNGWGVNLIIHGGDHFDLNGNPVNDGAVNLEFLKDGVSWSGWPQEAGENGYVSYDAQFSQYGEGSWHWFEMKVERRGDDIWLLGKAWPDGTPEPTGWMLEFNATAPGRFRDWSINPNGLAGLAGGAADETQYTGKGKWKTPTISSYSTASFDDVEIWGTTTSPSTGSGSLVAIGTGAGATSSANLAVAAGLPLASPVAALPPANDGESDRLATEAAPPAVGALRGPALQSIAPAESIDRVLDDGPPDDDGDDEDSTELLADLSLVRTRRS